MELTLIRRWFTKKSTIGELHVDAAYECFILEDVVRKGPKVHGKTAIPAGRYKIQVTYSPRFKRMLPILVAVPDFSGVRIHPGNDADDTEGCLLPGLERREDFVSSSRHAFDALMPKILDGVATPEGCWITIREERAA
jgi:hypothetical protein